MSMEAADYFAIQNQLNLYFQYVDAGDFENCGRLFAQADVTYLQSGQTFSKDPSGVTKLMQSFVKLYGENKTPLTRHHSGNIIIEPDGEKGAQTSCSAIIYQGTDKLPFQAIAEASYSDCFEKRDQVWVFTERKLSLNFMDDLRHHLLKKVSHD